MLKTVQTILLTLCAFIASAQLSITGTITDEGKSPVELAIISLQQDEGLLSNSISDKLGQFQFKNIKPGEYTLLVKHVAYTDTVVLAKISQHTEIAIQLQSGQHLNEVVVKAKKPLFEQQIDRLRFNVAETDLVFGSNVWEVVEKTPLVQTSSEGGIQISGTTGAIVYINNRKKILTGSALKSYLSSLPSENLEAIEVITTPSSKYDAEGGAGIINIFTKKSKEEGLMGNIALSARQTAVNSQAGSLNLTNRKGKWSVFSGMYLGNRRRKPEFKKDIHYPVDANRVLLERKIESSNYTRNLYPGMNIGIDHEINQNHVLGVLIDYSGSWDKETREANSRDSFISTDSLSLTHNQNKLSSQLYSFNLNYQGKLDSSGKTLSIDLDALEYRSGNNSISKTEAIQIANHQPLFVKDWFRSSSPQNIRNQSAKVDFEWPLSKATTISLGAKAAISSLDNTLLFEDWIGEKEWEKDESRSNAFKYDENINSLYAMINRKVNEQWSYQLGIRLENTIAKGWLEGTKAVDKNYVNVFPSAHIRYKTPTDKTFVLALSNRITRPSYWDVNPFRTYTTDESYFEGNPFLLPSKYYRQELSHTISGKSGTYTIQLAAGQSLDEIYALPYNPSENIIANKKVNYGDKYSYSSAVIYNNQLLPWWRLSGSMLAGYVVSKGAYADDIKIDNQSFFLSLSANQTFTLSKESGLSATLITNNTLPSTIVNTRIGNRFETEIRVRKSKEPWNITLSAKDFFKSNKDRYTIQMNDFTILDENYYDTRSVALALSYNFGKTTVKDKRNRSTGNQDERQRII